jgi:hypothetical protein
MLDNNLPKPTKRRAKWVKDYKEAVCTLVAMEIPQPDGGRINMGVKTAVDLFWYLHDLDHRALLADLWLLEAQGVIKMEHASRPSKDAPIIWIVLRVAA